MRYWYTLYLEDRLVQAGAVAVVLLIAWCIGRTEAQPDEPFHPRFYHFEDERTPTVPKDWIIWPVPSWHHAVCIEPNNGQFRVRHINCSRRLVSADCRSCHYSIELIGGSSDSGFWCGIETYGGKLLDVDLTPFSKERAEWEWFPKPGQVFQEYRKRNDHNQTRTTGTVE